MLRETGKWTYFFLNILGNSTKIGAVKRKSSENNGSLVSKQAKSCSEVTWLKFVTYVKVSLTLIVRGQLVSGYKALFCAILFCVVCSSLLVPDLGHNFYTQADGDNISLCKTFFFLIFGENFL